MIAAIKSQKQATEESNRFEVIGFDVSAHVEAHYPLPSSLLPTSIIVTTSKSGRTKYWGACGQPRLFRSSIAAIKFKRWIEAGGIPEYYKKNKRWRCRLGNYQSDIANKTNFLKIIEQLEESNREQVISNREQVISNREQVISNREEESKPNLLPITHYRSAERSRRSPLPSFTDDDARSIIKAGYGFKEKENSIKIFDGDRAIGEIKIKVGESFEVAFKGLLESNEKSKKVMEVWHESKFLKSQVMDYFRDCGDEFTPMAFLVDRWGKQIPKLIDRLTQEGAIERVDTYYRLASKR